MAIVPVYNCFHPVMKQKTQDVQEFGDDIKEIAQNLIDTMINTGNGVGLAANQIGETKSIFVIDANLNKEEKPNPIIIINPKISAFSEEKEEQTEGCLSVPDLWEDVERAKEIDVLYYDLDMKEIKTTFSGFLARVFQHEYDHLQGILFFERISPLRRMLIKNKLKKIEKGLILPDYPMVLPNGKIAK